MVVTLYDNFQGKKMAISNEKKCSRITIMSNKQDSWGMTQKIHVLLVPAILFLGIYQDYLRM